MSILILQFFFILNVSFAETSPEIDKSFVSSSVDTISQINNGIFFSLPNFECSLFNEIIKKNNKDLYNRCAVDLCGTPESNPSVIINDASFYKSASLWKKLKVNFSNSMIKKIYDIGINKKIKELEDLKKYVKNPVLEKMSITGQVSMASEILLPYISMKPNLNEKNLEDRVEISILLPNNASHELKEAVTGYVIKLKKSILTNPTQFQYLGIYSDKEYAQILKEMIKKVKLSYERNPESLKTSPNSITHIQLMENELYGTDKPHRDVHSAFLGAIMNINNLIAETTKKDALEQVVCDSEACRKVYTDYLKKSLDTELLEKNLSHYQNILKNPNTKKNAINRCKAKIIYREIEKSDKKKANVVFLAAKKSIINNLLPRFSEHSRKIMTDYLNNQLDVNVVKRTGTETIEEFRESARKYIEDAELDTATPDDFDRFESLKRLNNSFDEIDPIDEIYTCGTTSRVWDSFISVDSIKQHGSDELKKKFAESGVNDQVTASDFSCQNADHGHNIMMHEIGHALSNLILKVKLSESSSAIYAKARACVTSQVTNFSPAKINEFLHEGDSRTTEEDTADLLAALSAPQDKKIYFCPLLLKSPIMNTYADLSFKSSKGVHSSAFSRVIFEAINKDIPLPQSCLKLIEEEKPAIRLKKCEL